MKKTLFLLLTSLSFLLVGSSLHARVGESQSSLEGRLLRDQGKKYFREGIAHRRDRDPFMGIMEYTKEMSGNFESMVYWKRAGKAEGRVDLSSADSAAGWDFYVLYVNGTSVGEFYQRIGADFNDFELNFILSVNQGNSFWKKISNEEKRKQEDSFWGYDFELDDGSLRAAYKETGRGNRRGKGIMIFNSQMDKQLKALKDVVDENRRTQNEMDAPSSTEGF